MSLEPLLEAPWITQIHAFSAMAALVLGIIQLSAPKGTLPHKTIGAVWIVLMIAVTASSAFIVHPTEPGDPFWARFSWIHSFTILGTFAIFFGVRFLLMGGPNLKHHSGPFIGFFIGGLVVAGALSLLPGRIMNQVVFGG